MAAALAHALRCIQGQHNIRALALQRLRLLSTATDTAAATAVSGAPQPGLDADVAVVGAGVVGLAIARELALSGRSVLLLEAAGAIGTETSSRNSEVIHAGLYYPPGSLKARLCVKGRLQLYAFCERYGVPYRRLGKLLVATSEGQLAALAALQASAAANGVTDLRKLTAHEARELEPLVACRAALLSPSTGIVDSHSFMAELHRQFEEAGGTTAFFSQVVGGSVAGQGPKRLQVRDVNSGEEVELAVAAIVNSAGLHAQAVASSLQGVAAATIPPLHLAKGNYFSLAAGSLPSPAGGATRRPAFQHLIYPLPEPGTAGLGTHLTVDLAGAVRFGPDVEWLPPGTDPAGIDYSVSPERAQPFYQAIRKYLPCLPNGALQPAYSGVRPKVAGPGRPAGDFVVQGSQQHGVQGLVNLFGIESPGLTASLAIAKHTAQVLGVNSSSGA